MAGEPDAMIAVVTEKYTVSIWPDGVPAFGFDHQA